MAVKGITHRIVEIKSRNNDFFEKAVFYLKPNINESGINEEINTFLENCSPLSANKEKSSKKLQLFIFITLWSLFISLMTLLAVLLMID